MSERQGSVILVIVAYLAFVSCNAGSALSPPGWQGPRQKEVLKGTTSPCPCLYATDLVRGCQGGCERPELVAYPVTASGDIPPIYDIAGSNTDLNCAAGVALDAAGNIYAADCNSIVAYPAGATGNVAPIRTIAGSHTHISAASGIALDALGKIYVANITYSQTSDVAVFAAGANGNVPPTQLLEGANTELDGPEGLALDSRGHIYVSNTAGNSITVYAAGANGNRTPIRTITGSSTGLDHPEQLVVTGRIIIVANNGPARSVTAYPIGANGNVSPTWSLSGTHTHLFLPNGVAVDANENVYVANSKGGITVYAPGSNGDARPIREIRGHSTQLQIAQQVAIQ
jgi:6-phosphogluconolactonase (cycloisomerase 2 family)